MEGMITSIFPSEAVKTHSSSTIDCHSEQDMSTDSVSGTGRKHRPLLSLRQVMSLSCLWRKKLTSSKRNHESPTKSLVVKSSTSPTSTSLMMSEDDVGFGREYLVQDDGSIEAIHSNKDLSHVETLSSNGGNDKKDDCGSHSSGSSIELRSHVSRPWKGLLSWTNRFRKPYHRQQPLLAEKHWNQSSTDEESMSFSVSTNRLSPPPAVHAAAEYPHRSVLDCVSSCTTTTDDDEDAAINRHRVSLQSFFQQEEREEFPTLLLQLGEIAADDASASIDSACLAVSFDDDYPQLVLKTPPSKKELDETEEDLLMDNSTLGAAFPHPAGSWSRGASLTPTTTSTTPSVRSTRLATASGRTPLDPIEFGTSPLEWRKEFDSDKLKELWGRIDQENLEDNNNHDGTQLAPSPLKVGLQPTDWREESDAEEDVWDSQGVSHSWSHSEQDESVSSFSHVFLDKELFRPVFQVTDRMPSLCGFRTDEQQPFDEPATEHRDDHHIPSTFDL